jgi:Tol biopolymer transport system component
MPYIIWTWEGHLTDSINIWRADIDGSNQKQLTGGKLDFTDASCSPDGKWVYYTDHDTQQVKRVSADGGMLETVRGASFPNMFLGLPALS